MSQSVSVMIYGVNEAENFAKVVWAVKAHLVKIASWYQFVLGDDGSNDDSGKIFIDLKKKIPDAKVVVHPQSQGIGFCLTVIIGPVRHLLFP